VEVSQPANEGRRLIAALVQQININGPGNVSVKVAR